MSHKITLPFHIKLYALLCPDSGDVFSISFIFLYLTQAFPSPLCAPPCQSLIPSPFLCFLYVFPSDYGNLFTGEKAKGEDSSQWLSKIHIFPFIEDFPSSLPTVLAMTRWDGYSLISNLQARLGTGWLCQMLYLLMLDCILPIRYWYKTYVTDIQNHLYC